MMRYTLVLFVCLGIVSTSSFAQSNIETFTPSALFRKGQWELNVFNNLYTQRSIRDREGGEITLGQRQTFINSLIQTTYGASKSGRFNFGLDVIVTRAYYDSNDTSPARVFGNGGDLERTVISAIGPRIKVLPFTGLPSFSIQSIFTFPAANNLESPSFIAHDRYSWTTQFFYDHRISSKWRAFFSADVIIRFRVSEEQEHFARIPFTAFLTYFPTSKYSIFTSFQYAPRYERISNSVDEQFGLNQWFTAIGGGARLQATRKLSFELSYSNFVLSRNDGAGYSLNFGLRLISD